MNTLILNHGIAYIDHSLKKRTIFIKGEKIVRITESPYKPSKNNHETVLDCQNQWILPGIIDPHVHFRTPGQEYKEDWDTASKAALAGGITTVLDMPNTNPPTTTQKQIQEKIAIAQKLSRVNFGFHIGASHNNFDELMNVQNAASIKIYFGSTTGNLLVNNHQYIKKIIQNTRIPLLFHAENELLIQNNLKKNLNFNHYQIHGIIRNQKVAFSAVQQILKLIQKSQIKAYFCHITTKKEFLKIKKAKKNQTIYCEITPHHLFCNENIYQKIGHFAKVNPPLRPEKDRLFLYHAFLNNEIDIIGTDHAPHLEQEKQQNYQKSPSGSPGLEIMLPLLLNEVHKKKLKIQYLVKKTSENPALFFLIKNKGKIKPYYDADLTLVNPNKKHTIEKNKLYTKCKWSLFDKKIVFGKIETTIILGKIAYHQEKFMPMLGKHIYYKNSTLA